MFVRFKECTIRVDDIVKIVPGREETGGSYIIVKNHYVNGSRVDKEYISAEYDAVVDAVLQAAEYNKQG